MMRKIVVMRKSVMMKMMMTMTEWMALIISNLIVMMMI